MNLARQILQAVSRKVALGPSVDLEEIARLTEGYSGADLQSLVYNAHLQVVHTSIDATSTRRSGEEEEKRIQYITLGATGQQKMLSRAEESAVQKRVSKFVVLVSKQTDVSVYSFNK